MDARFTGRIALVTGAGSGIGRAVALGFAREGAKVAVVDVAGADGVAAEIAAAGGTAIAMGVDVGDAAAVAAMVTRTVAELGGLDCAYNNAGIFAETGFTADCDDDVWERIMAVNLRGVFLCMKHEIRAMLAAGKGGAIVNASSATAYRTVPGSPAYSASKAAVAALTRVAAVEYGGHGIRINAVAPAGIATPMLEKGLGDNAERRAKVGASRVLKRLGTPDEAADTVLYLCSDQASYITAHTMYLDGGAISAA